jgi:putative peptidoglycan lipid II flippase
MFRWSAQAIYSRAFFAAGNTMTPMVAGTIVTVASLPVYAALYRWHGAMGLAIASDLGIALQTVTIAVLLHQKHMVSLASLDYREMGRCLLAGLASGISVWVLFIWLGAKVGLLLGPHPPAVIRWIDLGQLAAGAALWFVVSFSVLEKAGSALPALLLKRLRRN